MYIHLINVYSINVYYDKYIHLIYLLLNVLKILLNLSYTIIYLMKQYILMLKRMMKPSSPLQLTILNRIQLITTELLQVTKVVHLTVQ